MSKDKMQKRLSAIGFAMWEMRIFLDTHPCDDDALKLFNEYKTKYDALKEEYEAKYGPLTVSGTNSDEWLKDPWPWD